MLLYTRKVVVASLLIFYFIPNPTIFSQSVPFERKRETVDQKTGEIRDRSEAVQHRSFEYLNGKMHQPVTSNTNHPYLEDNKWKSGRLVYKGKTYEAELLKYDIENDRLIVLPYNTRDVYPIAINWHELEGFTINDRDFSYHNKIDLPLGFVSAGYIEILYDGDTKFYLKWEKEEELNNSLRQIDYNQQLKMILFKDGQHYRVRNRLGLMFRLRDQWKEVRNYMRENNLRLYKYEYSAAKEILEFYDNLK